MCLAAQQAVPLALHSSQISQISQSVTSVARRVVKARGKAERKAQDCKMPRISLDAQVMPMSKLVLQSEKDRIEYQNTRVAEYKKNQEIKSSWVNTNDWLPV